MAVRSSSYLVLILFLFLPACGPSFLWASATKDRNVAGHT